MPVLIVGAGSGTTTANEALTVGAQNLLARYGTKEAAMAALAELRVLYEAAKNAGNTDLANRILISMNNMEARIVEIWP